MVKVRGEKKEEDSATLPPAGLFFPFFPLLVCFSFTVDKIFAFGFIQKTKIKNKAKMCFFGAL